MIVVLCGTNRPGSNTLRVARLAEAKLRTAGEAVTLLDLAQLPPEILLPASYADKPAAFAPFQQAILDAAGIVVVTPEYNGSYPGILKYFIDMLRFPESLKGVPCGFVGLAAGEWGGLRSVEQLAMIFQYRGAHLFGQRLFLKGIGALLDDQGQLTNPRLDARLETMLTSFARFAASIGSHRP